MGRRRRLCNNAGRARSTRSTRSTSTRARSSRGSRLHRLHSVERRHDGHGCENEHVDEDDRTRLAIGDSDHAFCVPQAREPEYQIDRTRFNSAHVLFQFTYLEEKGEVILFFQSPPLISYPFPPYAFSVRLFGYAFSPLFFPLHFLSLSLFSVLYPSRSFLFPTFFFLFFFTYFLVEQHF